MNHLVLIHERKQVERSDRSRAAEAFDQTLPAKAQRYNKSTRLSIERELSREFISPFVSVAPGNRRVSERLIRFGRLTFITELRRGDP